MKLVPNAFYLYVSDMERAVAFYESLFDMKAIFSTPGYVAYEIAQGVTFALWSRKSESLAENPVRTSELGLNITISPEEIDALYERWLGNGAKSVEPPHDAVFGRTFVVADPDGNLIRVAPVDSPTRRKSLRTNTLNNQQFEAATAIAGRALTFVEGLKADLPAAMIRYLWFKGDPAVVATALAAYQNDDGGFGKRLEPDIHAPASNPFAARLAMQTMMCLPPDTTADMRGKLGEWLQANQDEDGDWHFSEATKADFLQPWFAAWEFPALNPACCVAGWAAVNGIATAPMLARVVGLFATKASVDVARNGEFYDLLPYVEYTLATKLGDEYLDAIASNIIARGDAYDDAGHFFDHTIGGSDELIQRIPADLTGRWVDRLLQEPAADGGWPSAYSDDWRPWITASNLVTLARLRAT